MIARAHLASAVEAGGLGIIETSLGDLDAVRDEIGNLRIALTGTDRQASHCCDGPDFIEDGTKEFDANDIQAAARVGV